MKCLKNLFDNRVIRVTDEEAEAKRRCDTLEPKVWQFCPKHEWKAQRA